MTLDAKALKGQTIAFAASGGLDSCTITHWLAEQGVKVVAFTADLAQPDETDFSAIEKRMRACGASDFVGIPLQKPMAEIGLEGIQAQACYEGRYWLTTPLGRQVTVAGILPEMKKRKLKILAHGATGRGNDQVRFQLITNMLEPSFQVYAPWRDEAFLARFKGRQQMIKYCEQHGLPIKASRDKPYSTDANLLGLTHEGGKLEELSTPAHFVTPEMGVWAARAPDKAEEFRVRFEKGARSRSTASRSMPSRPSKKPMKSGVNTVLVLVCIWSKTASSASSRAAFTKRPAWNCSAPATRFCCSWCSIGVRAKCSILCRRYFRARFIRATGTMSRRAWHARRLPKSRLWSPAP